MKKSLLQFIIIIFLTLLICLTIYSQKKVREKAEEVKPAVDIEVDEEKNKKLLNEMLEQTKIAFNS